MKTAIAWRHLAFEDLGLIEPWLATRGWDVRYRDMGVDGPVPADVRDADLLVVLGGPIGAEDDARYPFLGEEVRLIRERLDSGRPLLGICLGAQLMARALGAAVCPMGTKEIGFAPLTPTAAAAGTPLALIGDQPVLHWHGDQFELPRGSTSLAATRICPHQAFMVGAHAMAWQFHLEVDTGRIEQWLIGHAQELAQAGIDLEALRTQARAQRSGLAATLDRVLDDWLARNGLY
jgi:GMP synthase (glutamine-hydrolysing)